MPVESGRSEDLDWWVPPNYPTSMGGGCHLFLIYITFPDLEQVKEWNRRLARFPRHVVLPAGRLVDLAALLEREDWGRLNPVRRCPAQSTGATELAADHPVVVWRWCCRAPPYLATRDPHVNHPSARHEYGWRRDERYLVSVLQLEFPRTRDYRRRKYVVLPKWWQEMEVPMGFPAMLPGFLAYNLSRMRPIEEGHRLYAILATQWVVEVAPVWVASLKVKGYLWHLSNALVEGMCTLTPARLGDGRDGDYAELLEEMIILHNTLDWVSFQPFLRRTVAEGTDAATRGFVHCFCGLSKGELFLQKRLGVDSYQALSWVSILVVDIFPPNILGQSIFALSDTQREYWYMKYPRMWVSDTHSSHIFLRRGYFAKWGITSCRDLMGTISMILDIIASARRARGLVVLTDSSDSLVP